MKKFDVVIALEKVRDARAKWAKAQTGFTADISTVMRRLVNEAAVNYMSPEEVAKASGLTVSRVRQIMRDNNLNPRNSRSLLAKTAASTLAENAALLGIEPRDFDLTSPLAYLPMGSELKAFMGASVTGEEVEQADRVHRLASLLACEWCGAGRSSRCVEWEKPIDTLHQQRINEAQAVLGALDGVTA